MDAPTAKARLSVEDWLDAGFQILAEQGRGELKIERLCEHLGVTKGSFYWHFTSMSAYRGALTEAWARQRGREHPISRGAVDQPPRERLSLMTEALVSPRHWRLERAMREWARTDATVAASVTAADRRALKAVRQAFADLGFEPEEAELRAKLTFAAGLGFLQMGGAKTHPMPAAQRELILNLLVRP